MSSDEGEEFVKVVEDETSEVLELPVENDDRLLLTTLQGQFPNAVGLRYQSSSGGWRGVRISDEALNPPHGGWGDDTIYHVTMTKGLKRKTEESKEKEETPKKPPGLKRRTEESKEKEEIPKKLYRDKVDKEDKKADKNVDKILLQDMIVFGLPTKCKDEDLKEYFTSACGEIALYRVKYNRHNNKPRGFGFIRFKTTEGAKAALNGEHSIMGKTVKIKMSTSMKKDDNPMKLFIGRIPKEISAGELKDHFEEFGEVKDVYIPQPARGFGFVTFASSRDGRAALKESHKIMGTRLNVQYAEPKEEKMARLRREEEEAGRRNSHSDYTNDLYEMDSSRNRDMSDRRDSGRGVRDLRDGMMDNRRYSDYDSTGGNFGNNTITNNIPDTASQLTGLLYSILGGR